MSINRKRKLSEGGTACGCKYNPVQTWLRCKMCNNAECKKCIVKRLGLGFSEYLKLKNDTSHFICCGCVASVTTNNSQSKEKKEEKAEHNVLRKGGLTATQRLAYCADNDVDIEINDIEIKELETIEPETIETIIKTIECELLLYATDEAAKGTLIAAYYDDLNETAKKSHSYEKVKNKNGKLVLKKKTYSVWGKQVTQKGGGGSHFNSLEWTIFIHSASFVSKHGIVLKCNTKLNVDDSGNIGKIGRIYKIIVCLNNYAVKYSDYIIFRAPDSFKKKIKALMVKKNMKQTAIHFRTLFGAWGSEILCDSNADALKTKKKPIKPSKHIKKQTKNEITHDLLTRAQGLFAQLEQSLNNKNAATFTNPLFVPANPLCVQPKPPKISPKPPSLPAIKQPAIKQPAIQLFASPAVPQKAAIKASKKAVPTPKKSVFVAPKKSVFSLKPAVPQKPASTPPKPISKPPAYYLSRPNDVFEFNYETQRIYDYTNVLYEYANRNESQSKLVEAVVSLIFTKFHSKQYQLHVLRLISYIESCGTIENQLKIIKQDLSHTK